GERLKIDACVHHADWGSRVRLLRLRHSDQRLHLDGPRDHPGDGRTDGEIVIASGCGRRRSDGKPGLTLVRDLRLEAAVDSGAHRLAEEPARERLGLDVLSVLASGLDAEDAIRHDLESAEAAAG